MAYILLDKSSKSDVLAVFKVFEHSEDKWYQMVKNKIGKIHGICNKKYYTRRNPL
jgi:hypothetical protein